MTSFNIYQAPGHLIRRAQQILVALFLEQTDGRITSIQFGVLAVLVEADGLDQTTLSQRVALDQSTSGATIERMEKKGWILRTTDPTDRRRRRLSVTEAGRQLFEELRDEVEVIQHRLLDPLDPKERVVFMRLLSKLVRLNNDVSRAPLRLDSTAE